MFKKDRQPDMIFLLYSPMKVSDPVSLFFFFFFFLPLNMSFFFSFFAPSSPWLYMTPFEQGHVFQEGSF
jgi:hypothetical protein